MKKILSSAGIAVFSAASMQAAYAPGLSAMDAAKPWSLSATLRGFYDDNYTVAPSGSPAEDDSFGIQVRPSIGLNIPLDQTHIGVRYTYDMKYYEGRPENDIDHTHQFDLALNHAFSSRYSVSITDSLVIAQEPELIDPAFSTPLRSDGDNLRNRGAVNFSAQMTDLVRVVLGYSNTFYDYEQDGGTAAAPSRSGLLDRIEHLALVNLNWQATPQTTGLVGYQFGVVDYTADEAIAPGFTSDDRNNRSHYGYVGADHTFRPDLTGSARVGVQYTDYVNDSSNDNAFGPYADVSLTYSYTAGSYIQAGISHRRNQTDVVGFDGTSITTDQASTVLYGSLNHRITPKLTGSLLGQLQNSTFNGGAADDDKDKFYLVGLNLAYRFNQHLVGDIGYNYDKLDSDLAGRGFTRNRVYIGVTANY